MRGTPKKGSIKSLDRIRTGASNSSAGLGPTTKLPRLKSPSQGPSSIRNSLENPFSCLSPLQAKVKVPKLKNLYATGSASQLSNKSNNIQSDIVDGFYATFSKHGGIPAPETTIEMRDEKSIHCVPEIEIRPLEEESDDSLERSPSEASNLHDRTKFCTNPSMSTHSEISTPKGFERQIYSDNEA